MKRLPHLIRRFFWTLRARPLGPREQAEVDALLRPEERRLFWDQPAIDQRHGVESARRAAALGRSDLTRAALLHDVGKRHANLGVLGRSLASGLALFGLRPQRWTSYYDHGAIGAGELAEAGAEDIVVEWARLHSLEERPASMSTDDWDVLTRTDGP